MSLFGRILTKLVCSRVSFCEPYQRNIPRAIRSRNLFFSSVFHGDGDEQNNGLAAERQSSTSQHILATKNWFERIVIGDKLCPFAPPLIRKDEALRFVVSDAMNEDEAVHQVTVQALALKEIGPAGPSKSVDDDHKKPETTLVIFDAPFVKHFRDFVRLSWALQERVVMEQNLVGKLQLVLFHPLATHQTYSSGLQDDDDDRAADYTIRSPYPTVHLLRETDVMEAVSGGYPDLENLPSRNKTRQIEHGLKLCKERLERCYVNGIQEAASR